MKKLLKELEQDNKVENYRIYLSDTSRTNIGVKGITMGGVYNPIQNSKKISGILHIEWTNGEVSFVNLNSYSLMKPTSTIDKAYSVKFRDDYSRQFISHYELDKKEQSVKDIEEIVYRKQHKLVSLIEEFIYLEDHQETHIIDVGAYTRKTEFVNSKGLNLSDKFTGLSIQSDWNTRLFYYISSRGRIKASKYIEDLNLLKDLYKATFNPVQIQNKKELADKLKVVVWPEQTWDLFEFYLFTNLDGEQIANNQSKFRIEQFKRGEKIFSQWLSLKVEPKQARNPGGYNFTSEGVEAKDTTFIKNGKLIRPVLDLKHAKKLEMKPNVDIDNPYITSITNKKVQKASNYIKSLENAIIVPYFLGLHTQNKLTGDYSLPCPYSIYIKDGEVQGVFKSIVTGNFFKDMKKDIDFIETGLFPTPGICYKPNIVIE